MTRDPFGVLFIESLELIASDPVEVGILDALRNLGCIMVRSNGTSVEWIAILELLPRAGVTVTAGGCSTLRPESTLFIGLAPTCAGSRSVATRRAPGLSGATLGGSSGTGSTTTRGLSRTLRARAVTARSLFAVS
jgi:hypothetical protein